MNEQERTQFFYEMFDSSLRRLGPGTDESTIRALNTVLAAGDRPAPVAEYSWPRVLDLGCGTGDFSAALHNAGCRVVASDSALQRPWAIEGQSDIPYLLFDYGSYELERMQRMDGCVVLLRHVLEHLLDPERFLRAMAGRGAEYFYILLPRHGIWEDRVFGRYYYSYMPPVHVWYFSPPALEAFLRRCGLEICARGFNIMPSLMQDAERFLRLHGAAKPLLDLMSPFGALTVLSVPFQFFFPRSAMWFLARAVKK